MDQEIRRNHQTLNGGKKEISLAGNNINPFNFSIRSYLNIWCPLCSNPSDSRRSITLSLEF